MSDLFIVCLFQCKKLPQDSESSEGYVTDEDEGGESEKNKKNNKRVRFF